MFDDLSERQREEVQEANLRSYIAGVFDSAGSIHGSVKKGQTHRHNYRIEVRIQIQSTRPQVMSLIEDWSFDNGMNPSLTEVERKRDPAYRLLYNSREDIRTLLTELSPYLLGTAHDARLVLDEILPRLENKVHFKKQGFIETVEQLDELHSTTSRDYDAEYFRDLWADELQS